MVKKNMHIYIYDKFLGQKKYESSLARIETRITDLGLNGKIVRLNLTNSISEAIENEVKNNAKSIIVVGSDSILNQAINVMAKLSFLKILATKIPLGFIPVGKKDNILAPVLGIKPEEDACDALSARRITTLDLGKAQDEYFLFQAAITSKGTSVEIDQNYSIEIMGAGEIGVINLPINDNLPPQAKAKANDGILELFIKTDASKKFLPINKEKGQSSVFSFKKLKILNKNFPVVLDNTKEIPTPVEISIAREKINLIVGKERKF